MSVDAVSPDSAAMTRRRRITRAAVIVVWALGVVLAIDSGWRPGFWHDAAKPWPYPLKEVLLEIAKITVISLGLYDFLRPRLDSSSLSRTARALGVLFITLVWVTMLSGTDQPGYAYATGNYVLVVTALLVLAVIGHWIGIGINTLRARKR
jgi:peptidoglycan/LPS O-acetylase OafA/YrhL